MSRREEMMEFDQDQEPLQKTIECEECNAMVYADQGDPNWKHSDWFICLACQESVPKFANEMIDGQNQELDANIARVKYLEELLEDVHADVKEATENIDDDCYSGVSICLHRAIGRLNAGGIGV